MNQLKNKIGTQLRADFPFYKHNPEIAYLDSGASSLTPSSVIQEINKYYNEYPVNIHRGVYRASAMATEYYHNSRNTILNFVGGLKSFQAIYTRNATESFNLLAYSLMQVTNHLKSIDRLKNWQTPLSQGDYIIISESEHHANIIPWQIISRLTKVELIYIPIIKSTGELDQEAFLRLSESLNKNKVKIISLSQTSNVTGLIHDLAIYKNYARECGAIFAVDGAQSVCHQKTNLDDSMPDFFFFSGHKMLGPSGIGVACGRKDILKALPPFMGGGDMIEDVNKDSSTYAQAPEKFEAGTPHIAGALGLAAAVAYLDSVGLENIHLWELKLSNQLIKRLEEENIKIMGPNSNAIYENSLNKAGIVSFNVDSIHPHDIGTILDENNIAIRVGHHCCQILMKSWEVSATCRASFYLYNDFDDVDKLVEGLQKVRKIFKS